LSFLLWLLRRWRHHASVTAFPLFFWHQDGLFAVTVSGIGNAPVLEVGDYVAVVRFLRAALLDTFVLTRNESTDD